MDAKVLFDANKKRKWAYKYVNGKIDGPGNGARRGLPNCVVAGIQGFMYGDGTRLGYRSNLNDDSKETLPLEVSSMEQEESPIADVAVSFGSNE